MLKMHALRSKVINETTYNFEIEGWVDARFVNTGTIPVTIMGITYGPREVFEAGVGNHPVIDDIDVIFDAPVAEGDVAKVVVVYGYPINCD